MVVIIITLLHTKKLQDRSNKRKAVDEYKIALGNFFVNFLRGQSFFQKAERSSLRSLSFDSFLLIPTFQP